MPFVDIPSINGAAPVSIHYNVLGTGRRRILFVMGLAATLDGWVYQQAHFAEERPEEYTICVYDNRGVGKSSAPSLANSVPTMANDALALLDHLGWESNVHLVGISMGGMISMQAASQAPHRFASLTLVNTHAGEWRPLGLRASSLFITSMTAGDRNVRLQALMKLLFSHRFDFDSDRGKAIAEGLRLRFNRNNRPSHVGFFSQLQSVVRHKMTPKQLQAIKSSGLPVLVCVGTDDLLVRPDRGYQLHAALGGELKVFRDIGHALISEAHDTFNEALELHIRKHDSASSDGVRPVVRVPNFDPLSPVDRLFVLWETPENSMSIAGLSHYAADDAPSLPDLMAAFQKWTLQFPRLRQKIHHAKGGALQWVFDHDFDLNNHIRRVSVTPDKSVQDIVAAELSTSLNGSIPLWNAVLIENAPLGGLAATAGLSKSTGSALFIQLHHAIADGALSVQMMLTLCEPAAPSQSSSSSSSSSSLSPSSSSSSANGAHHPKVHVPREPSVPDPTLALEDSYTSASSEQQVVEPKVAHVRKEKLPSRWASLFLLVSSLLQMALFALGWLQSSILVGIKMMGVNMLGETPFSRYDAARSRPKASPAAHSLELLAKSVSATVAEGKKTVQSTVDWLRHGENVWSVGSLLRGRSGLNLLKHATKHYYNLGAPAHAETLIEDIDDKESIRFPDPKKFVAWTEPLDLAAVKKVGKALNASVNDVLLSCAAGAFSRAFGSIDPDAVPAEIPVLIPFNMRARLASPFTPGVKNDARAGSSRPNPRTHPIKMGNESTMVWTSLPSSPELSAPQRVEEIKRRMNALKHSAEPLLAWLTVVLVGFLPEFITKFLMSFYGDKAAAVITNVPGPTQQLTLAGHRMLSYTGFIPTPGLKGIGMTIFSYNGGVGVSMTGNCRLRPSVETIVAAFAAEFDALKATVGIKAE